MVVPFGQGDPPHLSYKRINLQFVHKRDIGNSGAAKKEKKKRIHK
jgi:hypothetical protein